MRYDKKVNLVKITVEEDEYGGIAHEISTIVDQFDCFISPETIKFIDVDSGMTTRIGVAKIFTKAKINLDQNDTTDLIRKKALRLTHGSDVYIIATLTDLGKLTMIGVQRYV